MIDEKRLIAELDKDRTAFRSELYADDSIRKYFIGLIDEQPKINDWISCNERLPENEQEVEISCKRNYIGSGDEKRTAYFTARAFYTDGNMNTEDSCFCWDDCHNWEYDEEKDAYKIPEGWWEYVKFSEQFGIVDDKVLAWKPLPKPYKGDNNE